ncbi:WD40 repeat domain-containing protein [Hymenobacter canadensis]|uniref:WD40 repeat domain-containing protein n=1 Tax=Hymenobacter canadensis TaxID=2999067 RepID=A0ABY7LWL7_9BACT|nr:WD40 repeat domain-containing protein [Hymenobacter canadensis]WBA43936.1 WD40 repeat domain-containing protein [Hymenobacter canadensis]
MSLTFYPSLLRTALGVALCCSTGAYAQTTAPASATSTWLQADIKTKAALLGVDYSPDGKRLVTCGLGRDIVVYDVATRQPVLTLKGHTDDVVSVKFSPNGRYIASGGVDHALILWDAITGELIRKNTDHTDYVRDVAFSPDSKRLASAGWDGQALVFETFSGQRLASLKGPAPADAPPVPAAYDRAKTTKGRMGNVTSVAFSPDGTEILTASGDHALRIWDTTTWEPKMVLAGHTDEVWDARYAPNGKYVVSGAWDNTARIWDVKTQRTVRVLPAHVSDVWATSFSPDGQLVATGGGDRKVRIWDMVTGMLVQDLSGELHTAEVENLVFSPDGSSLASVSRDGTLKIWQVPGTAIRIGAYAQYNFDKWSRKGEFEKTVDFDARMARKADQLKAFQQEGLTLLLKGYSNAADWSNFTLKEYNADTEYYALGSALFPTISYRIKVAPRDAEQFRNSFMRVTYGVPAFEYTGSTIQLDNVNATVVGSTGPARQYTIVH